MVRLFYFLVAFFSFPILAFAHGVTLGDKWFIQETSWVQFIAFVYLWAKHMITGYDHLLFLLGVIFFLYRLKDITLYVTLFALGHIITLIFWVYFDISVNAYIIDTIIGFSVVYKALDNLGAFQRWFGFQPDTKIATLIFWLFHWFWLATKLQDFDLAPEWLFFNLISFNIGVEIGQIIALSIILIGMSYWRKTKSFWKNAYTANVVMIGAWFLLMGYQIAGFILSF